MKKENFSQLQIQNLLCKMLPLEYSKEEFALINETLNGNKKPLLNFYKQSRFSSGNEKFFVEKCSPADIRKYIFIHKHLTVGAMVSLINKRSSSLVKFYIRHAKLSVFSDDRVTEAFVRLGNIGLLKAFSAKQLRKNLFAIVYNPSFFKKSSDEFLTYYLKNFPVFHEVLFNILKNTLNKTYNKNLMNVLIEAIFSQDCPKLFALCYTKATYADASKLLDKLFENEEYLKNHREVIERSIILRKDRSLIMKYLSKEFFLYDASYHLLLNFEYYSEFTNSYALYLNRLSENDELIILKRGTKKMKQLLLKKRNLELSPKNERWLFQNGKKQDILQYVRTNLCGNCRNFVILLNHRDSEIKEAAIKELMSTHRMAVITHMKAYEILMKRGIHEEVMLMIKYSKSIYFIKWLLERGNSEEIKAAISKKPFSRGDLIEELIFRNNKEEIDLYNSLWNH